MLRCTRAGPRVLVILDSYRNWGFPKGHVREGESASQAARREILEETALSDLTLHAPLGSIDWFFRLQGQVVHKYCHFYLFESRSGEAVPQETEGITACAWHPIEEALDTVTYDNARGLLRDVCALVPKICGESTAPGGPVV